LGRSFLRVRQAAIHCSKKAVTDEVTAQSFDMHPEDIVPFFPVEDSFWGNFQVFGDLSEGDSEAVARNERLTN
jgi:hypothetical protein